jgi:dTDP-4-dehydrorhamnose 3,5-epimerase
MIFHKTELQDAYIIEPRRLADERGFFARSWCQNEFKVHDLNPNLAQCSISFNHARGTLRGMHFQFAPYEEAKVVRCTMGSIYDVIVDIRPDSPTYLKHIGVELNPENRTMLYVPEGFAHGFITLSDNSEVFYQMSEFYNGDSARGYRWDDPAFGIVWPLPVKVISERDATYPAFPLSG